MIEITNIDVFGWESAVRGMRNPMDSWDKIDSEYKCPYGYPTCIGCGDSFCIGENDLTLMKKLSKAGSDHAKYKRMINVTCDIVAPLYWWKEFDTYKVGTVANSCSTMHKIHSKKFELDDFSCEHIFKDGKKEHQLCIGNTYYTSIDAMIFMIDMLNFNRQKFIETKDKCYWWQMIQLLPSSYNQKRTIQLNYEVLTNMYHSRKNHKLDEWREFCRWIESLPYSELIIGGE